MTLPFAEKVNYWKTGGSGADRWMERAKREIEKAEGRIISEGFGRDGNTQRAAFFLAFEVGPERFKILWPVLPTKSGKPADELAARRQAATLLYHDVKARCISSRVLGARVAFFSYWCLPDGRAAAEVAAPELLEAIPGTFRLLSEGT